MNRHEIMKLSSVQLRAEIAKILGIDITLHEEPVYFDIPVWTEYGLDYVDGWYCPKCGQDTSQPCCPNWNKDIEKMFELEEDIPKTEQDSYTKILHWIVYKYCYLGGQGLPEWNMAHATASQRARAWLIWKHERIL